MNPVVKRIINSFQQENGRIKDKDSNPTKRPLFMEQIFTNKKEERFTKNRSSAHAVYKYSRLLKATSLVYDKELHQEVDAGLSTGIKIPPI